MTLRGSITLVLVLAAQSLAAQGPTVGSSATAARQLLPVLDDYGQVIAEDSIRATMRPPEPILSRLAAATIVGAFVFHVVRPKPAKGADCSIYDPCTPREEYYKNAWVAGAAVGFIVGYGTIGDKSLSRWQAVEILRARRRAQHKSVTPP